MSDFQTFPANHHEALALLYVERQDTTGMTPEELLDMYSDALDRIRKHTEKRHAEEKAKKPPYHSIFN